MGDQPVFNIRESVSQALGFVQELFVRGLIEFAVDHSEGGNEYLDSLVGRVGI